MVWLLVSSLLLSPATSFLPSGAEASTTTLRHSGTKFRVQAPRGFRLRVSRGIYTIRRGQESVTIMRLRSPVDQRSTARGFASNPRLKKPRVKKRGGTHQVTGTANRRPTLTIVSGRGPVYTVTKYTLPRNRSRARNLRALTLRDVAELRRIANSARGGIVSPLPPALPTRRFTQGGATALVPDLPGWSHNGAGGALSGGRAGQGSYALGIAIPLFSYVPSGNAVANVWPTLFGAGTVVTSVAFVPGSEGVLGPSFDSGFYLFRFVAGGVPYEGFILSGTNNSLFYYSYIAVREGLPPGIGQTLLSTWSSWDPSANANQRLAQTLNTIRTTPIPGNPIDQRVFDRLHDAWTEYIRR